MEKIWKIMLFPKKFDHFYGILREFWKIWKFIQTQNKEHALKKHFNFSSMEPQNKAQMLRKATYNPWYVSFAECMAKGKNSSLMELFDMGIFFGIRTFFDWFGIGTDFTLFGIKIFGIRTFRYSYR